MTPAPPAPLARRASRLTRLRLYAPFTLLLLLAGGCASAWTVGRSRLASTLDAAPAVAAAHGIALELGARSVSGFPFRLRVRFASARATRGGWAVNASGLIAQAYVFAPRHWVVSAPEGLTVERPDAPSLVVRGQALRASVSGLGSPAWRLVLQGDGLRVDSAPAPGMRPFALQSARRIELDARPSAHVGDTDMLLQAEGAVATPESVLWQAASGAPFGGALSGRRQPGGAVVVERLAGRAGPADVSSPGATLRPDASGRLAGVVPLRIVQAADVPPARPGTPAAVAIARTAGHVVKLVIAGDKASLRPGTKP